MKLLTVAIPCYNSQDYMEHAVETALVGGEDVEIILVNDGSSDKTAEIADRLQKEHPTIVRAIHQENGGHGAAVNTGLANASGLYYKVLDSDDWFDRGALMGQMKPEAEKRIRTRLALEAIVDAEKIKATAKDIDKEIENMANMYQMEVDKIKEMIGDAEKEQIGKDLAVQKAVDFVVKNAVEVEPAEE